MFHYVTPVTIVLICFKKGPGGCLIRVDLIRFPGSIPGATQMCTDDTHQLYLIWLVEVSVLIYKLVLGAYSCK